jgi:hypothetical protein
LVDKRKAGWALESFNSADAKPRGREAIGNRLAGRDGVVVESSTGSFRGLPVAHIPTSFISTLRQLLSIPQLPVYANLGFAGVLSAGFKREVYLS